MSSPSSNCASGAIAAGVGLAYEYGSAFATNANAARPKPFDLERRLELPALRGEHADDREREGEVAGPLAVAVRGPCASTRRTASASRPTPAENAKRRPLTRPRVMRRVRPRSSASATCAPPRPGRAGGRARAAGRSCRRRAGSRSACPPSSPFSASLKPPSPEKTTIASAPPRHALGDELGRMARTLRPHDGELGDARELRRAPPRASPR